MCYYSFLFIFFFPLLSFMIKSLQISFEKNPSNSFNIFLLDVNFENRTVRFYVIYVLNMHIKFGWNQILFAIRSINLFLCIVLDHKMLKFKHLIDNLAIDLWSSYRFASIENIIRVYLRSTYFIEIENFLLKVL